jgi:hypothetical protein
MQGMQRREYSFKAEQVAYWFFRLNGCMSIVNFLVHHELRGREGTEVDILAVRFPHRAELTMSGEAMRDHEVFDSDGRIDVIMAEVKKRRCRLNGRWTDPDKQNMHRILYAVGAFPEDQVPMIAQSLYERKCYAGARFRVRLFALGQTTDDQLSHVVQLTWNQVLTFIYDRLKKYRYIKAQHRQWDRYGRQLCDRVQTHQSCRGLGYSGTNGRPSTSHRQVQP